MSEQGSSFSFFRQTWIPFAAIAATAFTLLGFNNPSSKEKLEPSTSKNAEVMAPYPNGLVVFQQSTWEDPFAQLSKAHKAFASAENLQPEQTHAKLREILYELVTGKHAPDNKATINQGKEGEVATDKAAVDNASEAKATESKGDEKSIPVEPLAAAHRTHLLVILNLMRASTEPHEIEKRIRARHAFEIALSQQEFRPILSDRLSFLQFKDLQTKFSTNSSVTFDNEFPIKVYRNKASNNFILNIWIDQNILGASPWDALDSVVANFADAQFRPFTQFAIVGPGDSDQLEKMKPDGKDSFLYWLSSENGTRYKNLSGWRGNILWYSHYCTVPLSSLWRGIPDKTSNPKDLALQFHSSIADDDQLMRALVDELSVRLGANIPQSKRQILVFAEQDREFGRMLATKLKQFIGPKFEVEIIPYLRGISELNSPESAASSERVTDYFRRTLYRQTSHWLYPEAKKYKPAAIGILGGVWEDRAALIGEVRKRFPQSLCFTNDYDARFLDENTLGTTRNLVIASHQDPMPSFEQSNGQPGLGIAFRDEYQAALFNGMIDLTNQAFLGKNPRVENQLPKPVVFEVANAGAHALTVNDDPFAPIRLSLLVAFGSICIVWAFVFPLVPTNEWSKRIKTKWLPSSDRAPANLLEALALRLQKILRLGPEYCLPLLVLFVCLAPFARQESSSVGIMSLVSGINVIPSIILLSFVIPILYRRSMKLENSSTGRFEMLLDANRALEGLEKKLSQLESLKSATALSIQIRNKSRDLAYRDLRGSKNARVFAGLVVTMIGGLAWFFTDDAWLIQTGVLIMVGYQVASKGSTIYAIAFASTVGVAIGILRLTTLDYSIVPARDGWIRAIGSCLFAIANWWLHVGLFKSFIYLIRLRDLLSSATSLIKDARDEDSSVQLDSAKSLQQVLMAAGELSSYVLRDLGQMMIVGLVVCLARLPVFDAWGMSTATWITIFLPMAIPFTIAVMLRRQAWHFRDVALQLLTQAVRDSEPDKSDEEAKKINSVIDLTKAYDRGAFAPLDRDPLIGAGLALLMALFSGPNSNLINQFVGLFVR
jgi:hypothetical protein